jgi:hypothetical protein
LYGLRVILSVVRGLVIAALLCAAGAAHADRCAEGAALAKTGDLPKAALYLEGCDGAAAVEHKLGESDYSSITISTTPAGLTVETTAMPGETLTSPVTVWAKAGRYDVRVVGDGQVWTQTVQLAAHSRVPVVFTTSAQHARAPHKHVEDFEVVDPPIDGPPPVQKHPSLLPCKFANACTPPGDALDDPFDTGPAGPHDAARVPWRVGVRVGGGIARVGSYTMSVGVAGALRLAPRLAVTARAEWTRREAEMAGLDATAIAAGVATPIVVTERALVTAGLAARGELRLADTFEQRPVHTLGLAGDATIDLVLRRVPIVMGARVAQGITPLVADARETAVLLELGIELR